LNDKQREACDLISKIDERDLPKVIKILQIFAYGDFATVSIEGIK